jgi:hypothetical protein
LTAIMVHSVLYRCDGARCKAEVLGHSGALPDGWREWHRKEWAATENGAEYLGHLCPKCKPPEAK